jgi:GT2 family glycosyltransferase
VIPVHNKAALTRQCVDALLRRDASDPAFEIVVVDDASSDGTGELLRAYGRGVRAVTLPENAGFAGACNAGASAARGDYLVFLNNDTVPQPRWLGTLVRYADVHLEAAVVGAKLLYPDETIQHAGVVFGPNRYPHHLYAGFPVDHPAVNVSRRFRAVTAACMLVRRTAFEAVGGFDRAFVNGWEDVDLCLKLGELGHEVHYCHESVVYHLESASRNVRAERELRNRSLYADRWLDRIEPDSLRYYLEDGLLWVEVQGPLYPVAIQASPLLGVFAGPNREATKVLGERANQVAVLQRANVLLHDRLADLRAREADLAARLALALGEEPPPPPPRAPAPRLLAESRINWPSEGLTYRVVSVVLPLAAGARLGDLLGRLLGQRRGHGIELVAIVDDETEVAALREVGAAVIAVPSGSPPGALRNLAAAYAKGVVLIYLEPGAIPANDAWLANLLAPLDGDPTLAVVVSGLAADGDGPPPDPSGRIVSALDDRASVPPGATERSRRPAIHFLGTAVRTDVVAEVPFPDGGTRDDDRAWTDAVLEAGYAIQYEPTALLRR